MLFADIVGFTTRSDHADPEDVRRMLLPFHARVKEDIERFGGTLDKFIGDAAMGVFGAPVAHEDDAARAIRAALRILDTITELNDRDPTLGISVRIGINTGEAVVSFVSGPVVGENVAGDVVNTASRLQGVAPPGGIIIGQSTHHAARDAFEFEALDPVTVKGKAEPLEIWRVVRARGRDTSAPAAPFVGREHELASLVQCYDRVIHRPALQLVTVIGEPGIGKSRLIGQLRSGLAVRTEPPRWLSGGCLAYGEGIAFRAVRELVREAAGIADADPAEVAEQKLAAALETLEADPSEREWLAARLAPLAGADTGGDASGGEVGRDELFTAWLRFLELVAGRGPLVLLLEDLHWAEAALLEFVDRLTERLADLPVLLVATARPDLLELVPAWGGGRRNTTTIDLARLTDDETDHLLLTLLARAVLPAETRAALLTGAGGNPLYAQEFVRMLSETGALGPLADARAPAAEIPVPDTVQAVISARLDALPAVQRSVVQDAAALGDVFWPEAIAAMDASSPETAIDAVGELVRKGLVVPVRDPSLPGHQEFAFAHALIRDVAYRQLSRSARSRKHLAAGEWIEGARGDLAAEHPEQLAYHFSSSVSLARAAGEEPAIEAVDRARRYLTASGDRARHVDLLQAADDYLRALELTPYGHPLRADLVPKVVQTGRRSGRLTAAEAEALTGEWEAQAKEEGDPIALGRAKVNRSSVLGFLGEGERARALIAEAIEILEGEPPGPELANAYAVRAEDEMLAGRPQGVLDWSGRAFTHLPVEGHEELRVMMLQIRGIARCELGDDGGLEDLREALRVGRAHGLAQEITQSLGYLGEAVWQLEGPAQGLAYVEESIEFATRRGLLAEAAWLKAESSWELFDLGGWDRLLERADEIIAWAREHGGDFPPTLVQPYRDRVFVHRGRRDDVLAGLDDLVERARGLEDIQVLAPTLATAAIAEPDDGRALAFVEELEECTRDAIAYREAHLPDVIDRCLSAGRPDLAARQLAGVEGISVRHRNCARSAHALLAEARGEHEAAVSLFVEAAHGWAAYGAPFERARAELGWGRCLVALGRSQDSAAPLRAARDGFGALLATPWIERVDAVQVG